MSDTLEDLLDTKDVNGLIAPKPLAYERARAHLASVPDAPPPEFTPDGEGGIDIEWEVGGRCLILWCRGEAHQQDSICWHDEHSTYQGASAENLKELIQWLTAPTHS